jgi:hypothetical protein
MSPPVLAQALVAAVAPASDYEIVAGDLHEEYLRIMNLHGAEAANRWYWAQTLRSIPSLLSYSRSNRSVLRRIGVALIALAVLVAMLIVTIAIQTVFETMFGIGRIPDFVILCVIYVGVVVFGAILGWLVRTDGLRVTFFASIFLVLCFVVPAVAGHPGSQAPLSSWIDLFGAVPVMCMGAGISQAIRRRIGIAR